MTFNLEILALFLLAEQASLLLFGNALNEGDGDLHRCVGHSCGSLCKDEACCIALVFGIRKDPQDLSLTQCIVDCLVAKDDAVIRSEREEV